jgi:ribosomal protein L11 methyltransferase
MSPAWMTLRVEVAAEVAEGVAAFLVDEGAPGLVEEKTAGRVRLEAPLPAVDLERVVQALERYLASLATLEPAARRATLARAALPTVDWAEQARRHHRPVAVGRRLLVAPPWEIPPGRGREVLVVEPGMAFGTGRHPTTRGCLEAIEAEVGAGAVTSALDVGTGSGILALALARLGVPHVVALDADPAVLAVAGATLARNRAAVHLLAGTVHALRARFDLVVANLLADTLRAEAAALEEVVRPGGRLVLSGLLEGQAGGVAGAYPAWRVRASRASAGWTTLTLERRP